MFDIKVMRDWQCCKPISKKKNLLHVKFISVLGQKRKSLRFVVIGQLQNRCSDAFIFYFLPTGKYVIHVYAGTKFPHKLWWQERPHKSLKTQNGIIPINPAILAASFHSQRINKILNVDLRVWGDVCRDQKPRDFFWELLCQMYKKLPSDNIQIFSKTWAAFETFTGFYDIFLSVSN